MTILTVTLWVVAAITILTLAHTISDVFLQPRHLAMNKHHSHWALTQHVLLYGLNAWLLSAPIAWVIGWLPMTGFWLIQMICHWIVDAITSRGNNRAWTLAQALPVDDPRRARQTFYAIAWICVDQIIHLWFLCVSFLLFINLAAV